MHLWVYGCSPPCCREHAYTSLKYTDEILRGNGIKYWLIAGTLLGAIRDNDLVKIAEDTDVGIMEEDVPKLVKLIDQFAAKGMPLEYSIGEEIRYIAYRSQKNHNCVEFFIYREDGNGMLNVLRGDPTFKPSSREDDTSKLSFRKDDISNLEKARIRDTYFPVPSNPIPHLLKRYGDWTRQLEIDTLDLDPPAYDSETPYINRFSEDREERKKWARLFMKIKR